MATILGSKIFEVRQGDLRCPEVGDWLSANFTVSGVRRFRLTLETVDEKRQGKTSAGQILERLAAGGHTVWKRGDYEFRFTAKEYFWKGEAIYITAGEALYLYRRLVRKEAYPRQWYLYHMRKRFGKEFLAEFTGKGGR
jgi:hypothetical protein